MDPGVVALSFVPIFLVELPDKTFVAALVLSTRYRPLPVWLGIGAAFAVQCLVAVTAGHFATLLPVTVLHALTALVFAVGAVVLVKTAPRAEAKEKEKEEEYASRATADTSGWRAAGASFVVLFVAEWGDLSQLLTIALVARYQDPVSVFLGSWGALLVVSGLAVLSGRFLLRHLRLSLLHYAAAVVCSGFALYSAYLAIAG
jgi:putative Ca2+/H+ antiporter (TMEM165/GDT1 family)